MEENYERLRELGDLLGAAKRKLEEDLSVAAGRIVGEWSAATGLAVEEVWVPMLDVTSVSDAQKRLVVGQVKVVISGIGAGQRGEHD